MKSLRACCGWRHLPGNKPCVYFSLLSPELGVVCRGCLSFRFGRDVQIIWFHSIIFRNKQAKTNTKPLKTREAQQWMSHTVADGRARLLQARLPKLPSASQQQF